jgi:hypothetical protein
LPNTWGDDDVSLRPAAHGPCIFAYPHSGDKIGCALVETERFGHAHGDDVGNENLYEENDGNDGEIDELFGSQLRRQLREDYGQVSDKR